MTRSQIESLVQFVPVDAAYTQHLPDLELEPVQLSCRARHLSLALTDPRFGWKFINGWSRRHEKLPVEVTRHASLVRAYHALKRDDLRDTAMVYTLALEMPDLNLLRSVLKCALVDGHKTEQELDQWLSLPAGTARLYNDLFFNVLDRRNELAYLTAIVWPDGRLVEMSDAYLQTECRTMLMLRTTLTNGLDSALQMAGMSNLGTLDGISGTTRLESSIMTNANRIADWGGLNQSQQLSGLQQGKSVLVAVRGAGESSMSEDDLALHNINAVLPALDEIRKYNGINAEARPDHLAQMEQVRAAAAFARTEQQAVQEQKDRQKNRTAA